jgi:hypothetical protein
LNADESCWFVLWQVRGTVAETVKVEVDGNPKSVMTLIGMITIKISRGRPKEQNFVVFEDLQRRTNMQWLRLLP